MKTIRFILSFIIAFSFVSKSQTVSLVAESKQNLCLMNHEVIQGTATGTPSGLGFYGVFSTQKISPAFYSSTIYPSAVFVDNHHKRLLIGNNINAFNTPQYSGFYSPFYSSFYGFGNSAVADLNNNGTPDIVSTNSKGHIYLHRNISVLAHATDSIQYSLTTSGHNARVYLTKADADAYPDLISIGAYTAAPFGYYFSVYKNISTSSTLSFTPLSSGYAVSSLTFAPNDNFSAFSSDLNNDGTDEILFVSDVTSNSLTILYSIAGNYNASPAMGINAPGLISKKVLADDFNRDGQKQIAMLGVLPSFSTSYVYLNTPNFVSGIPVGITQQSVIAIPHMVNDFVFTDLNRDSLKDLVVSVANTGSVLVYMQNRVGANTDFATPPIIFNQGLHISGGLASFDVDHNGIQDIISFNTGESGNYIDTSSISILKNFTYRDSIYAIPTKSILCPGETVILKNELKNHTGGVGYYSTYSPSVSAQAPSHTITIGVGGTYSSSATYSTLFTFPVSASSCIVNSNTIQINNGIVPVININAPNSICSGQTASISATGASSYSWSNGALNVPSIDVSPTLALTYYTVSGRSLDGCIGTAVDSIFVHPDYLADVTYDKNFLCRNDKAKFAATGGQTYTWSTGETSPSIVVTQTATASQNYTVVFNDGNGCLKIKTIQTVFNDMCNEVVIKNGITPNGDGENDVFYIENIDRYPDNMVRIYNRWGTELFNQKGYDNVTKVWPDEDSHKLPSGTYFYVIDLGNGDPLRKGWIEMLSN